MRAWGPVIVSTIALPIGLAVLVLLVLPAAFIGVIRWQRRKGTR